MFIYSIPLHMPPMLPSCLTCYFSLSKVFYIVSQYAVEAWGVITCVRVSCPQGLPGPWQKIKCSYRLGPLRSLVACMLVVLSDPLFVYWWCAYSLHCLTCF